MFKGVTWTSSARPKAHTIVLSIHLSLSFDSTFESYCSTNYHHQLQHLLCTPPESFPFTESIYHLGEASFIHVDRGGGELLTQSLYSYIRGGIIVEYITAGSRARTKRSSGGGNGSLVLFSLLSRLLDFIFLYMCCLSLLHFVVGGYPQFEHLATIYHTFHTLIIITTTTTTIYCIPTLSVDYTARLDL